MLTQEDVIKIIDAQKGVFVTKDDLAKFKDEMREYYSDIQSAIDGYAKKSDTYFQEMVMLAHKVGRHEKWLQMMADKLGVKLEY